LVYAPVWNSNLYADGKQSGFNGCILAGKNCPPPVDSIYHFTSLESPLSFEVERPSVVHTGQYKTTREKEVEMATKRWFASALALGALWFVGASVCTAASEITPSEAELCLIDFQKVPRMTIDELKAGLDDTSVVIIDVRAAGDWEGSSIKIKGAVREVYADAEKWVPKYDKNKTIVLYCA
jgi:hypothetical protein